MKKQEFEQLTGLTVTDEYFERIYKAYMAVPQDKETFCKQWVEDKDFLILQMAERVHDMLGSKVQMQNKAQTLAEAIIRLDMPDSCGPAYDTAYEVLGTRDAIIYKAEHDIALNAEDKKFLRNNL